MNAIRKKLLCLLSIFALSVNSYGWFVETKGDACLGDRGNPALRSDGYVGIYMWTDKSGNMAPVWMGSTFSYSQSTFDDGDAVTFYMTQSICGGLFSRVDIGEFSQIEFMVFQVPELVGSSEEEYAEFAQGLNDLFLANPSEGESVVSGLWDSAYALWEKNQGGYLGDYRGFYVPGSNFFGDIAWDSESSLGGIDGKYLLLAAPKIPEPSEACAFFGLSALLFCLLRGRGFGAAKKGRGTFLS